MEVQIHKLNLYRAFPRNMSQPIYVMNQEEETRRSAFAENVIAIQAISELIKTTFGPKSMQKLLFDKTAGAPTITNDAAKILEEINISHPGGRIIMKQAKAHKKDIGDGTSRLLLFSGALLTEANELVQQGVHPTTIIKGISQAKDYAIEQLQELSEKIDINDKKILVNIANTTMASRNISKTAREKFAEMLAEAVLHVKEKRGDGWVVDLDDVQTLRKMGKDVGTTDIVKGLVIDKEVLHRMMPTEVKNAKIAIIDSALEVVKTTFDAQVQIQNSKDITAFKEKETNMLKELVNAIVKSGANVVFCQKGIDEPAQRYLYDNGILAARRVKKSDMYRIAKATGGKVINDIKNISPSDLGSAGLVIERQLGIDRLIFIEDCKDPKAISILIRGFRFSEAEADEAMRNALNSLKLAIEFPYYIAGGGATLWELSERVATKAKTLTTKEQMVWEAFANAMEKVPLRLAENGGLPILDIKTELNSAHKKKDGKNVGVDFDKKGVSDMVAKGVIEPVATSLQIIKSVAELANVLLNVDEMIDKKDYLNR